MHPTTRPRDGDLCYSDGEFTAILENVHTVHKLGFPELVMGVLEADGNVGMPQMRKIMAAAGPLAVTFHHAFGMCANPLNTLNNLMRLGITRVLTSGQKPNALQGLSKVMELVVHHDTPIITAGAGVRAENLHHLLDAGVLEVHNSAGAWQALSMRYRSQGLSMSSDVHADEYLCYIADGAAIAGMKGIIERHQAK